MDAEAMIGGVCRECGLHEAWAHAAAVATLSAIAGPLPAHERGVLAARLPAPYGRIVLDAALAPDADRAAIVARVAQLESVREGFALEHLECVLRVIGALLEPDERRLLRAHLPRGVGDLWPDPRDHTPPAPRTIPRPARPHLSDGRPGYAHPIAQAAPERAHSQSVARSDDPHADRRLSSAKPARR